VNEITLCGLRAENPLAFIAALGALSLADHATAARVRLGWRASDGTWLPFLAGDGLDTREDVVNAVACAHEQRHPDRELGWEQDIMKVTRTRVRELLASRMDDPDAALLLAACLAELPLRHDGCSVPYTPFRLIPRKGRARFLDVALRESNAGVDHLEACMFEPWTHVRGVQSLRWDPAARVQARALMAEAPTHAGTDGVPGAVLLAVRGLSCFPLIISRHGAVPPGLTHRDRFVWPIWSEPLELPLVRMVLSMRWLHQLDHNDRRLRERAARQLFSHGVLARFAAPRVRRGADDEALGWGVPIVLEQPLPQASSMP
jgi:hypothetical protein